MIWPDEVRDNPMTIRIKEAGEDLELKVMAHCLSVVEPLTPEARRRVLNYLCERFPIEEIMLQKVQS